MISLLGSHIGNVFCFKIKFEFVDASIYVFKKQTIFFSDFHKIFTFAVVNNIDELSYNYLKILVDYFEKRMRNDTANLTLKATSTIKNIK